MVNPEHLRWLVARVAGAVILAFAQGLARADCYDDAARFHAVNPWLLRAIAWAETHNHGNAIHVNPNGSIDFGLMQINSVHLGELARYGVTPKTLMQPCPNVYVAAWHLRHMTDKYGNTWTAVGAYHSESAAERDRYARRIIAILTQWGAITPPAAAR